jgi:Ca-activated chloride channel family protein
MKPSWPRPTTSKKVRAAGAKVLFVVTDGEDNASRETLEEAVKQLQEENGPSVYAIGILGDEEHPKRAKRALEIIAQRTGGMAFFPKTLDEVDEISRHRGARHPESVHHRLQADESQGKRRLPAIRVEAKAKGHGKLTCAPRAGTMRVRSRRPARSEHVEKVANVRCFQLSPQVNPDG